MHLPHRKQGCISRAMIITKYNYYNHPWQLIKDVHVLDLTEITSNRDNEITLIFKQFGIVVQYPRADDILHHVRFAYESDYNDTPEAYRPKINVLPESRLVDIIRTGDMPCGNFASTYRSLCSY